LKESPTALDGRGNVRQLIIVALQAGHVKGVSRRMQIVLAGHVPCTMHPIGQGMVQPLEFGKSEEQRKPLEAEVRRQEQATVEKRQAALLKAACPKKPKNSARL
jgi:hypothetical protein